MNLKQKLVLLLADPEVSENEFRNVRNWLERGGITQCIRDAEEIRLVLGSRPRQTGKDSKRSKSSASQDPLVSEVHELLRTNAGMTARAALEELLLKTDYPEDLPERISFADGVRRISREVGESKLLSAAYQIRNEVMHDDGSVAWPLIHDR